MLPANFETIVYIAVRIPESGWGADVLIKAKHVW